MLTMLERELVVVVSSFEAVLCHANINPPGGDSHMKVTEMLVVSLRVVNCRFWSHLGC